LSVNRTNENPDLFPGSHYEIAVYQDFVFHSHHSLFSMISRSELERNIGWERQLDFCTGGCTAGDFEQPADSLGSLSHSGEAPVSLSSRIENLWLDSASVVTNPHCKVTVGEFQFKIDALCAGMTKGVEQGLSYKLDLTCESGGRLSTTTPSCNEVPKNVCRRVSWSSRAIRARSLSRSRITASARRCSLTSVTAPKNSRFPKRSREGERSPGHA
jgi:hypothetical protein